MQMITHCSCGQSFSVDDSMLGTSMQCPTCNQVFTVTSAASHQSSTNQAFETNASHLQNRYAQPSPGPVAHPVSPQPNVQPVNQPDLMPLSPLPDQPAHSQSVAGPSMGAPADHASFSHGRAPGKRGLWIGLGVGLGGAAILLLLLLLLIGQFLGGGSKRLNLAYLPEEMSQFFFCDVEGLLATDSGKSMIDQGFLVRQYFGHVEKVLQIDIEDIESITVGYVGTDPTNTIRPFNIRSNRPAINFDFSAFFRFCAVIRTKNEIQSDKVMGGLPMYARMQHDGKTYYCDTSSPPHAFAFPESKAILFGTETEIKKALEGSSGSTTGMFNGIKKNDQVVFINSLGVDMATGAKQVGLAVSFGDEVSGRLWLELPSAEQARQLAQAQKEMQKMLKNIPDNPAFRRAKAKNFIVEDPFGLGEVSVSGNILTTEFSGKNKLVTTATTQQAVVGMLRPFSRFGNRNFARTDSRKKEPVKQPRPVPKKRVNPHQNKNAVKTFASLPRYTAGTGKKIDLLEIINPSKDQVRGDWSFKNQQLVNGSNSFRPRFQMPYKPPTEYDLKIVFRQEVPAGKISVIIPGNLGRPYSWVMEQSGRCQFSVSSIMKNPSQIKVGNLVKPNVMHSITIQKRANLVRAVFDGRILAEFKGPWGDLKEDIRTRLKNRELLGFACEAKTTISQIELVEVRGTGTFVD